MKAATLTLAALIVGAVAIGSAASAQAVKVDEIRSHAATACDVAPANFAIDVSADGTVRVQVSSSVPQSQADCIRNVAGQIGLRVRG